MHFGMSLNDAIDPVPGGSDYVRVARALEAFGFRGAWIGDHVLIPKTMDVGEYPLPDRGFVPSGWLDPFSVASMMAAVTTKLRLATGVLVVPYRPPALLAHAVSTVDRLSSGRFILGAGIGWMRSEFEALGVPFNERGARADETLQIVQALLAGRVPDFESRFFALPDGQLSPPPDRPTPIYIGGEPPHSWRRTAAFGSGIYIARRPPAELKFALESLKATMEQGGRDFYSLDICLEADADELMANPDLVQQLEEVGVHELIFSPHWHSTDIALEQIERISQAMCLLK